MSFESILVAYAPQTTDGYVTCGPYLNITEDEDQVVFTVRTGGNAEASLSSSIGLPKERALHVLTHATAALVANNLE